MGEERGYRSQKKSARVRAIIGAKRNGRRFATDGVECSLRNNFSASASGWGRPARATLLGPFRS